MNEYGNPEEMPRTEMEEATTWYNEENNVRQQHHEVRERGYMPMPVYL